ncbi:MAG: phosphoglucomutase/phosphomannomutase family protein [Candidatus Saganbacteria bacterium]|nr:phosphoglucomutase/phosphomannomutase family protein [Candidatus Saganbacteria bacterium]
MIKFGTDGWRAVISDEFTFANVKKVGRAIARYLIDHKLAKKPLIIGYDPRFLADKFAEQIAKIMEEAGINVFLTERDTPTPIIAWEVRDKRAAGAVVLTASHNPAQYCGIKFIPDYAGPANETITAELQENSNRDISLPEAEQKGKVERFEPRQRYLKYLASIIDVSVIKQAELKVIYDAMHGAGRGYTDLALQEFGCKVEIINGERDVLFGGSQPEPADEYLGDLKKKVVEAKAELGLANDGDADRFGVIDERGIYLKADQILALVFDYLVKVKGYHGSVVRSVGTSSMLDRIAARHHIKVHETPVGFKHIAGIMLKEDVIIGGEESGGLSIKGHIPEKDGILADLLIVEMVAKKKKPLSKIWQALIAEVGDSHTKRINLELTEASKQAFMKKLADQPPQVLAGLKVKEVNKLDGVKLLLSDGSWVLARPSGTEPLVRTYAESDRPEKLDLILEALGNLV